MILLILLLLVTPLLAQEEEQANRFFEAKEYVKALDVYEGLLKKPLTPWQRSVVQYNRGSVLLASHLYSAAIDQFLSISLGSDPFPLLSRRIYTNIAVAKLGQAEQIELNSILAYEKAAFLLHEARAYTKRAVREECAQQKLEGAKTCTPAKDLDLLEARIREKFRKGIERFKKAPQFSLLDSYELALLDDPLQEVTLQKLLEEQKLKNLPTEDISLSIKAIQQDKPLLARFYLQKARFQLTKILHSAKRGSTPLQILEAALENQHEALVLNRLAERSKNQHPEMVESVKKAQEETSARASPFKESVYQQQQHDFAQPGSLEERCQSEPWRELLPLFDAGYLSAQDLSLEAQEETLQKWNQALKLLQQPKKAFEGTCHGGSSGKQKEDEQQTVPMNQVLQNIQKMAQEDREPEKKQAPIQGERPW